MSAVEEDELVYQGGGASQGSQGGGASQGSQGSRERGVARFGIGLSVEGAVEGAEDEAPASLRQLRQLRQLGTARMRWRRWRQRRTDGAAAAAGAARGSSGLPKTRAEACERVCARYGAARRGAIGGAILWHVETSEGQGDLWK
jgi:hypothetical protein